MSYIIDGGTLSNFPVWVFDVDPRAPGADGEPKRLTFGFDIFHTAQEAWDTRFVSHSTRVRTVAVDAADVGTTDFGLDDRTKDMLVENGREAARKFLDWFNPGDYINTYHAAPPLVAEYKPDAQTAPPSAAPA